MERFRRMRDATRYSSLFSKGLNLHPVPFFGDLVNARALTLALNPAETEFQKHLWPKELAAPALTERLINYFDLDDAAPHPWFDDCTRALSKLGVSYLSGSAHVDLLSYPTRFLKKLTEDERAAFAKLVAESRTTLQRLLGMCKAPKLVIVIDYQVPAVSAESRQTFDYIEAELPFLAKNINNHGEEPPVFRGGEKGMLNQRILQYRDALRKQLAKGTDLDFAT